MDVRLCLLVLLAACRGSACTGDARSDGSIEAGQAASWPVGAPLRFTAAIGGGLDGSDTLEMLPNGVVRCTLGQRREFAPGQTNPKIVEVSPSSDEWALFYQRVAHAQLMEWRESYRPRQPIHDGTQWRVALAISGRSVDSSGDNAYPPAEQYEEVFAAVRQLVHLEHSFW